MADAVKPVLPALNLLFWRKIHRNLPCAAAVTRGTALHAQAQPLQGCSAAVVALVTHSWLSLGVCPQALRDTFLINTCNPINRTRKITTLSEYLTCEFLHTFLSESFHLKWKLNPSFGLT